MSEKIKVAELFAGIGGFRLGLEGKPSWDIPEGDFEIVWANQWEPPGTQSKQFAYNCYVKRFDPDENNLSMHSNEDISEVVGRLEKESATSHKRVIPQFDMLVAGFPCQDYSVAQPLSKAGGLEGKKGILWWSIYRILELRRPKFILLENVDRMLKSPAHQKGRDFAIILSCLNSLGYSVEWRVLNAADYGHPQRRKRVFIFGVQTNRTWNAENRITKNGLFVRAFPISPFYTDLVSVDISSTPDELTKTFGLNSKNSPFRNAGIMQNGIAWISEVQPNYSGPKSVLKDVLDDESLISERFYLKQDSIEKWEKLKDRKSEERLSKNGHQYTYAEGKIDFPDNIEKPSRTILTSEGGTGASRSKHVIEIIKGKPRRLTPDELDQLQTFPKGWTDTDMTDNQRAFCVGNALVVDLVRKIGCQIIKMYKRKS